MVELRRELECTVRELRATASSASQPNTGPNNSEMLYPLAEISDSLLKLDMMTKTLPRENIVLRRLYFDAIHRREDTVDNAHSRTFTWILDEEIEDDKDVVEDDDGYVNVLFKSSSWS